MGVLEIPGFFISKRVGTLFAVNMTLGLVLATHSDFESLVTYGTKPLNRKEDNVFLSIYSSDTDHLKKIHCVFFCKFLAECASKRIFKVG